MTGIVHGGMGRVFYRQFARMFAVGGIWALLLTGYSRPSRDAGTDLRKLEAGDCTVSISPSGAVRAIEMKGRGADRRGWRLDVNRLRKRTPGTSEELGAGEIVFGDRTLLLNAPSGTADLPEGLRIAYDVPTTPPLRVEILYHLSLDADSARLTRDVTLTAPPAPGTPVLARFDADLTVRLPLAPVRLGPSTWLPLKNGTAGTLGASASAPGELRAAYRFAGKLRSPGAPLAIPMVTSEASSPARVTVVTDPYFSTLFTADAVEWTYPGSVGLENGRESRTVSIAFHDGTPDDAIRAFYALSLPDVPPGPAWLHDVAMVDYDYLSDAGRGWFRDIDALAAAVAPADRSKVLLCLHGWYDFVGRYSFDRAAKTLDRSWTAFSNYPNVKSDFPNSVPVALTVGRMHERLAYAKTRGFRVALYFADGLNAGEGLADIYAPERVLYRGGWRGPDTKGRTYCQNPLRPEVYGFYVDYVKALLDEYGGGDDKTGAIDALVWDETFLVPDGSLGSDACPGYADRANMRLVKDITAEVRAFGRRTGREIAFMASDCIGVFNWVTKAPYALVSDGTYQDTHCAPEAWSYGVFPNLRNVLWSCNWEPVTHFDYTEFGARAYQTPVAISNGWGDDIGFGEMTEPMRRRVLDLFEWRKGFPTRLRWFEKLPGYEGQPNLRMAADRDAARVTSLSWDTEGGDKVDANLLRAGNGVRVQSRAGAGGTWLDAKMTTRRSGSAADAIIYELQAGSARLEWHVEAIHDAGAVVSEGGGKAPADVAGSLKMSLHTLDPGPAAARSLRLIFPFDPKVTATTVIPGGWFDDGTFRLPAVVNAPDWGPMLLSEEKGREVVGRLEGSRADKIVDLTLELPEIATDAPLALTLTPLILPPPEGLRDTSLWTAARRGWLNALQPCARWGEQDKPFSAPPGILGNNVISDPASVSIWFYADQAFFMPEVAPGLPVMPLVRRTIDYWLDNRMRRGADGRLTGEITGYWDYGNFLDANASPLIAAWDYVEATGDVEWLTRRIDRLELVADFLAGRDVDGDGFVEATQSGDPNALQQPNRSDAWWDALNCGHKDGYTNALIYRGWRTLADLERKLGGRADKVRRYGGLADRLKAGYAKTLYNPKTGWLAWWKSRDGELHDYASPTLNGLAIEYGLVEPKLGRQILDRLWAKMAAAGFTRFDLGVPPMLIPVRRSDYLQPNCLGIPTREDGTDTFGYYMNGGITAGHVLHFLAAHYVVAAAEGTAEKGLAERADRVLGAMLERQRHGEFQNGVRDATFEGIDWTTWDGKPSGYEGYLADSFRFLQAVLLREPAFRAKLYRPLKGSISGPKT